MTYWFACEANGDFQGAIAGGSLFLGSFQVIPTNAPCPRSHALTQHSFIDSSITDAGGFVVSADVIEGGTTGSVAAFAIGAEIGNNLNNYQVRLATDFQLLVVDNNLLLETYNNNVVTSASTVPTGLLLSDINNIKLIVQIESFAAGTPGIVDVLINNDASFNIPSTPFTWDGGNNHIGLAGSASSGAIEHVEYGALEVSLLDPTLVPPPASTGTYTECAIEGEVCTLTEPSIVRYGANGVYVEQTFPAGNVPCTNDVFGDPLGGITKSCAFLPTGTNN